MNKRIIKFRAWDTLNSIMRDMHSMEFLARTETRNQDRFRLMQFTGLTDKNGKEIYEGDIGKLVLDRYIPQYAVCVCEWSDEYGSVSWVQKVLVNYKNPSRGWAVHVSGFEVIGNIYENPELLTDSPNKL